MDETGAYYTEWSKPERKTPIQYTNTYIYGIYKDGNDNPVCETAKEKQMYRIVFQPLWEKVRVDDLSESHWNMYIFICETNHQCRFDAWDRVLRAGTLGWPRGMGWGGKWEGGFRMGNTCTPMADSCLWQKPLQYCKVISFQLK